MSLLRNDGRFWIMFLMILGQLIPHYAVEYRKHFTNFHAIVVDTAGGIQIGQTE